MTGSPRDLDPKFKEAKVPSTNDDNEEMIVHREHYTEDGVQKERLHRVKLADWPNYETEHGF
jgi:hypothetical protein